MSAELVDSNSKHNGAKRKTQRPARQVEEAPEPARQPEFILSVGEKLTLTDQESEAIKRTQLNIQSLQQVLAEKYEAFKNAELAFKSDEAATFQAMVKSRQELHELIKTVGNNRGLQIDSSDARYGFDFPTMTFNRIE